MAVRRLIRRWTSLTLLGLRISIMALHFSGLGSMSRCVSMKPRNLPRSTPNTHFLGFTLRLYYRSAENTVDKSCACLTSILDLSRWLLLDLYMPFASVYGLNP